MDEMQSLLSIHVEDLYLYTFTLTITLKAWTLLSILLQVITN